MKIIIFDSPHRQKHFDFFNSMNHPHFNITVEVDVTNIVNSCKTEGANMTAWMVYHITKAAMSVKEMRWRIKEGKVVQHDNLTPSFTVQTEKADVFSFCTVDFQEDRKSFLKDAERIAQNMLDDPDFEDEVGKDNYLFLSSIPWLKFTSVQHAMHYHPCDSVPRITWGKFEKRDGRIFMPIAVQVHHALMDARHVASFINALE